MRGRVADERRERRAATFVASSMPVQSPSHASRTSLAGWPAADVVSKRATTYPGKRELPRRRSVRASFEVLARDRDHDRPSDAPVQPAASLFTAAPAAAAAAAFVPAAARSGPVRRRARDWPSGAPAATPRRRASASSTRRFRRRGSLSAGDRRRGGASLDRRRGVSGPRLSAGLGPAPVGLGPVRVGGRAPRRPFPARCRRPHQIPAARGAGAYLQITHLLARAPLRRAPVAERRVRVAVAPS